MSNIDVYSDSYIINYKEGDRSLQRREIEHLGDINDKFHVVKQGETLTSISYKFYKNPRLWFIICDANTILNPLDIESGDELLIPNLDIYEI